MSQESIIFLSSKDPNSTKAWSGIPYFMFLALSKHYRIEYQPSPQFRKLRLLAYYLDKVMRKIGAKKYLFDYGILLSVLTGIANSISLRKYQGIKFIFCPAGLAEIAFLKTKIPIVTCGDSSMLQLIDYYPILRNVSIISKWEIEFIERRALRKSSVNLFSSDWASNFITNRFNLNNVRTISFGANILNQQDVIPTKEISKNKCSLIFVGVDWERKGGDLAIRIQQDIQQKGVVCKLIIIGSSPSRKLTSQNIEIIETLDKIAQKELYRSKFEESDFMILPTQADCTPIVIAESFAFGVPVVASNTGGISCMINRGINGFLIDRQEPELFAKVILETINNNGEYMKLSKACIESFKTRFTWDVWAAEVKTTMA